jgi:hypothetical protein
LDGDEDGKDGDVMYPTPTQYRGPNVGLAVCLLFCLVCWAGLAYLIGRVLE